MESNEFPTLKSLVNAISALNSDIDKLFAIYYFCCHFFNFNSQKENKSLTPNDIFKEKLVNSSQYAIFFTKLVKKVNITSFEVFSFSCISKTCQWNSLNPPKKPQNNSVSVCIIIKGECFLSEPIWADQGFHSKLFLKPLISCLNNHFPTDNIFNLIGFDFTYSDFLKAPPFFRF